MTTMEDIEAWVAEDPENRRAAADRAMRWFSLDGVGILFRIADAAARSAGTPLQIAREVAVTLASLVVSASGGPSIKFCQQCGFMFYGERGDVCEWTLCAPCARGEQGPGTAPNTTEPPPMGRIYHP